MRRSWVIYAAPVDKVAFGGEALHDICSSATARLLATKLLAVSARRSLAGRQSVLGISGIGR